MLHDFQNLKTISVADGEVAIRVPQGWEVWPQEGQAGCWECYEAGEADTGTLWIQVDHFHRDDRQGTPAPSLSRDFVGALEAEANANSPPPLESSIVPVDGGYHWHRVFDVEENGEALRFWFSRFFFERGDHSAVISINFVLSHAQMDEPAFAQLPAVVDREIRRAFVDPFRSVDEAEAEEVFGPLLRADFDHQVRLVLPQAMGSSPHGGRAGDVQNQWYCRFDTEASHAGMFILTEVYPFAEEDDAAALMLLADDSTDPPTPPADQEKVRVRRTPWGVVSYKMYDDEQEEAADEGDAPPLRNHLWTYIRRDGNRSLRLRVLLMIPLSEIDASPFPQLVAHMDGAVRRAEFPGSGT